jgi:hypothetical protein
MQSREFYLELSNTVPFDQDNWFETFVGTFVLPLLATGRIARFWFTRYSDGTNKQAKVRYEVDDYDTLRPHVASLVTQLAIRIINDGEFDIVGDLSGIRFLGDNQRQTDYRARGDLIFDFLDASSRLFVDCLSHADADGRWTLETNKERANNPEGSSFQTFHHLFCNLTNVPLRVVVAAVDGKLIIESPLYYQLVWVPTLAKASKTPTSLDLVPVRF